MQDRLSIEQEIYICKNDKTKDIKDISRELGVPQILIKETLDILKANGLYEQFKNMTEEEIKSKTDIKIPLYYNSLASRLLEKKNFNKSYQGFEYWKKLIALIAFKPEYIERSLEDEIYPIIARKCTTSVQNVYNQLKNSLIVATNSDGISIEEYLKKILKEWHTKQQTEYLKEPVKKIIKEQNENQNSTEEKNMIDEIIVKVPLSFIQEHYYMKGYLDCILQKDLKR